MRTIIAIILLRLCSCTLTRDCIRQVESRSPVIIWCNENFEIATIQFPLEYKYKNGTLRKQTIDARYSITVSVT